MAGNAFALSLLMPRVTFRQALLRAQNVLGLRSKLGIYVTVHPDSIDEYDNLVAELARWCYVPQNAVKVRLHELGLVKGPGEMEGHLSGYL